MGARKHSKKILEEIEEAKDNLEVKINLSQLLATI